MAQRDNVFSITFTGKKSQEVCQSFADYFWDGGLDQHLKSEFLAQFGLDLEDVHFGENVRSVLIDTNGHQNRE